MITTTTKTTMTMTTTTTTTTTITTTANCKNQRMRSTISTRVIHSHRVSASPFSSKSSKTSSKNIRNTYNDVTHYVVYHCRVIKS